MKSRDLYREMIKLHQGDSPSVERLVKAVSLLKEIDSTKTIGSRLRRANGAGQSESAPSTGCESVGLLHLPTRFVVVIRI